MKRFAGVALCLFLLSLMATVGCKNSSANAQTSDSGGSGDEALSGPPVAMPEYGAREPRRCATVTSAPTAAQAKALVQCDHEGVFQGNLILVTDLVVNMGSSHAASLNDTDINNLDSSAKVYSLTGQGTNWSCGLVSVYGAGTNCQKWPAVPSSVGRCWHTLSSGWKCGMTVGGSNWVVKQPAPTVY